MLGVPERTMMLLLIMMIETRTERGYCETFQIEITRVLMFRIAVIFSFTMKLILYIHMSR